MLRSIRRPSVCRNPFPWSADPVATKHHTPRLTASRLRSAYAVGCLIVAAVRKALAKSIRRGAEHTTSPPSPLRVARVRFLRAHGRVLAMEYTSKRAMGAASFFGSVVLYDAILRILCPPPSSRGREKQQCVLQRHVPSYILPAVEDVLLAARLCLPSPYPPQMSVVTHFLFISTLLQPSTTSLRTPLIAFVALTL